MPKSDLVLGLAATLLLSLTGAAAHAQQLRSNLDRQIRPTEIQELLKEVDESLRGGKWKAGLRLARTLTDTVVRRTWYGRESRSILSELALYQAVAEANLDRRDEAIWHWHIAQNLDSRMRRRDLAPYGKAGKLLYEFPLRARGEVPPGFTVIDSYPGGPRVKGPVQPKTSSLPTVLNNTGAALEGSGDFQVELIIDERGQFHQPVVISTHLHPIVIYASLEWLRRIPPFEPARFEGEPTDSLDVLTVRFHVERW